MSLLLGAGAPFHYQDCAKTTRGRDRMVLSMFLNRSLSCWTIARCGLAGSAGCLRFRFVVPHAHTEACVTSWPLGGLRIRNCKVMGLSPVESCRETEGSGLERARLKMVEI